MKPQWEQALKSEMFVAKVLFDMEQHGWPLDIERVHEVMWNIQCKIDELNECLEPKLPPHVKQWGVTVWEPFKKDGTYKKMVEDWYGPECVVVAGPFSRVDFVPLNLASDKQVKEFLLSIGWVPDEWNRSKKTGQVTSPKLTESSFGSIGDKWPYARELVEWIKLTHRMSQMRGWLRDVRPDGRLAMVINNMTPTYRCTHKGIVNVPGGGAVGGPAMRSCFVSDPGYKIVGIDSMSNQVRMLCHYMRDAGYTDAVVNGRSEDGTDVHSVNMRAAGLPSRKKAKNFFYALIFGGGDEKLGTIVGGGEAEGMALRDRFMRGLPAFGALMQRVNDFYKKYKYLLALDFRKLRPRSNHMQLVYLLQGAEAVYMKVALGFVYNRSKHLDRHLVGFVHDELQWMVKEEHVEEFARIAKQAFVDAGIYLNLRVPMEGDLKIGDNWRDTH